MEIITIMLVSKDLDYAYTFAKCMSAKNNRFLFTVVDTLSFHQDTNFKKYDVLLLDGEHQAAPKPFIQLVEKRVTTPIAEEQQLYLYKYENTNYFESQILFFYGMITGRKEMHLPKENTKILTFHGSCGGSGKTSVSLGLAQELKRFHDKKILYINYEEIESTPLYFRCEDRYKTISDYLYYINSGKNIGSSISSFTIKDEYGVETFAPSKGRNELKALNNEELSAFFKQLLECGLYDFILVDSDGSLTDESLWILSVSDQIIVVERYGEESKQHKFRNYLEFCLGSILVEKVVSVVNFCEGIENEEHADLFIDADSVSLKSIREGNFIYKTINIDKDFGVGIKELYAKLTLILQ
ncbi:AAA family ATPase [Clostridium aminobutyricum]|uniref:AAA family ATPase n=1 Tax=Clostridium aminobutyricum TaxID=33953 RepID=A0A939D768_CLOAM|nr:AAA family ATPase [Clostridium aminobutyricum]MBN7772684.1 AAA family ATPase [Clostridium aminobutyricum]